MTILFRSTWALSAMIARYALAKVLTHKFRLFGDSVFTFISDPLNSPTFSGKQRHASILIASTRIYHAEILHRLRTVGMVIFSRADFPHFPLFHSDPMLP